jgi:glycosyltransferase involved in cell wall biosynthesis/outer membrane murein-binding lipoprotein Lpp
MERVSAERQTKPNGAQSGTPGSQELHKLQRGVRELSSRLEALDHDVAGMRTQAQVTEKAVTELRQVDAWQDLRAVQRRIDELTSEIGTESGRLAEIGSDVEGLGSRVEAVEGVVKREGARRENASKAVVEKLRELRRENRALKKDLKQLTSLSEDVADLRRAMTELQVRERQDRRPGRLRMALQKAWRRARRAGRLLRRRIARLLRRARGRTVRAFRLTRGKIRRGLRAARRRLFGPQLGRLVQHRPKKMRVPRRYERRVPLQEPPVISIVTPSLNQAQFVGKTVESVLRQHYPRLEYVVQDGGSTDDTPRVLKRYRSKLHRLQVEPDNGQAHAINLGFQHTTGEIMAYLNADDLFLPGTLFYVARYFQRHPDVDAVYGHRVLVDDEGMEVGRWVLPRHRDAVLSWVDYVPQETLFWRRSLWEKAGGRVDDASRFALDWDLVLRFRDAGARIVRLPRFLGAFRVHEEQKTSAEIDTAGNREMASIRQREHGRKVSQEEIRRNVRGYMLRHVLLHKLYRARLLRY